MGCQRRCPVQISKRYPPPNTTNSNLLFLLIVFTLTLHCLIFFALLHCSYAVYILLHVFRIRCSTFRCVPFPLTSLHSPSIFSTRGKGDIEIMTFYINKESIQIRPRKVIGDGIHFDGPIIKDVSRRHSWVCVACNYVSLNRKRSQSQPEPKKSKKHGRR